MVIQWNKIRKLSATEVADSSKRFVKLMEEVGEFSAAYLEADGFKVSKTSKTKEELREHLLEEGVDSLIMILDILAKEGYSFDDIRDMMDLKLDVWGEILKKK